MARPSFRSVLLTILLLTGTLAHMGCLLDMTGPESDEGRPDTSTSLPGDGTETIAAVRIDQNADGIPDRLFERVTVEGVVISVNLTASVNRWHYHIEDSTGGLVVTKENEPGGGRMLDLGDRISATGMVAQYNGATELEVLDVYRDVVLVRSGTIPEPQRVLIAHLLAFPEEYESEYIRVDGVWPAAAPPWWPALGAGGGLLVWDGQDHINVFIDTDSDIDGSSMPSWPVSIIGVFRQHDTAPPFHDGYSLTPNFRSDFR